MRERKGERVDRVEERLLAQSGKLSLVDRGNAAVRGKRKQT
jgi:hypothetical protein